MASTGTATVKLLDFVDLRVLKAALVLLLVGAVGLVVVTWSASRNLDAPNSVTVSVAAAGPGVVDDAPATPHDDAPATPSDDVVDDAVVAAPAGTPDGRDAAQRADGRSRAPADGDAGDAAPVGGEAVEPEPTGDDAVASGPVVAMPEAVPPPPEVAPAGPSPDPDPVTGPLAPVVPVPPPGVDAPVGPTVAASECPSSQGGSSGPCVPACDDVDADGICDDASGSPTPDPGPTTPPTVPGEDGGEPAPEPTETVDPAPSPPPTGTDTPTPPGTGEPSTSPTDLIDPAPPPAAPTSSGAPDGPGGSASSPSPSPLPQGSSSFGQGGSSPLVGPASTSGGA